MSACVESDVSFRSGDGRSSLPRTSSWSCTEGVRLTVLNEGSMVRIQDSRGVETDLPQDPPGQRVRYAKTGFALVIDGRTASWFASGKRPTDCRR
ncbi:MAG: hypothetical protein AAGI92_12405 [Pseudomonadota bacterium]